MQAEERKGEEESSKRGDRYRFLSDLHGRDFEVVDHGAHALAYKDDERGLFGVDSCEGYVVWA